MIPLVVANEQGSDQAFNPLACQWDMWSMTVTFQHQLV